MEQQLDLFEENNDYIVRKNKKITLPLHNLNGKNKMTSKAKVVKVYKDIPPVADFIRFGNDFVDEFLSGKEATKLSINALKIVFNIISQLRNEQFQQRNNPRQLTLFEQDFASSEFSTFSEMRIKNSLITRDSELLKKAYEFLESYKKGRYKFTTSDGKNVEAYGGLITQLFYLESGYTSFLISSYWMKRLLQIDNYNKTLYKLVYNIRSSKHILFYFWLSKIPMEGTTVKLSTLNEYFDVEYKNAKDMCSKFLKSIRENLNRYSHKSFNYNYLGELITIKPYLTQYVEAGATESEKTKEEIKSDYKLRYFKDRHQLDDKQLQNIKNIFEQDKSKINILVKAYELFVEECRKKKIKTTDYIGWEFLKEYQKYVDTAYEMHYKGNKHAGKCYIKVMLDD
jgi:hypothetical protein